MTPSACPPQIISISAANRPGLLTAITAAFRDLNLDVAKAAVEGDEDRIADKFYVQYPGGGKIEDARVSAVGCVAAGCGSYAMLLQPPSHILEGWHSCLLGLSRPSADTDT